MQSSTSRGYVKGEPLEFIAHHHERARSGKRRDPMERFWEKVDKRGADECWEWTGARLPTGYGVFNPGGKVVNAHRYAYELLVGPIPTGRGYHGICVCHRCDNPPCVNPAHLFLGNHRRNMHDMQVKGRASGARGERHRSAKLTPSQVQHVRRTYTGQRGEMAAFAERYGVTIATIQGIIKRRTWRHLD